ncbi:MAG TPA: ion channel [Casimicrobiaceae bacterium]|nr:ion channel [Casimicrobiaceae bacterium]
MTANPLVWIGLAGIGPDDNARARLWQQRLHGVMIGVALLALPAYLLDAGGEHPALHHVARVLDGVIFGAFLLETLWMLYVTSHPARYLVENWLNILIIVGSASSAGGAATDWIALIRVARVAVGSLVLVRALSEFRVLFTRRGAPLLVGMAALIMLSAGGIMYWLEPTVHSYWDGLWLSFVTGMTIGYGDYVPTSGAARVFAVFVALVGVALMTLFTANVVAFFIGDHSGSADKMGESLRREIALQTAQLEREVQALRADIAELKTLLARDHDGTSGEQCRPSSMSITTSDPK